MKKEAAEKKRQEMEEYKDRHGLNTTEFAKLLSPDKDKRASVGKFLRGDQDDLRGGFMGRFADALRAERVSVSVSEGTAQYGGDRESPWPLMEKQLQDLLGLIRDPDRSIEDKKAGIKNVFGLYAEIANALDAIRAVEQAN